MTTITGDLAFDPLCGSGTTGEVCQHLKVKVILSDISEEYTQICENRLRIKRLESEALAQIIPISKITSVDNTVSVEYLPVLDKKNQTQEIQQMTLNL